MPVHNNPCFLSTSRHENIASDKYNKMDLKKSDSIQKLLRWPLLFFQIIGFMPVKGVFNNNSDLLKFSWTDFRTCYAILTLIGFIFLLINEIRRFFIFEMNMTEIQRFWYFLKSCIISIVFINLARKWPSFIKYWQLVETQMSHYGWPKNLKKKISLVCASFLITFLSEYFFKFSTYAVLLIKA